MLITIEILRKAIIERKPLFHNGDYITEQVYDELFKNLFIAKGKLKKLRISRETREILCFEMEMYKSRKEPGDKVYLSAKCPKCENTEIIAIGRAQICKARFDILKYIKLPGTSVTNKKYWISSYISYEQLFINMYGESYMCNVCVKDFVEDADRKAMEILERKDKFEWFLSNKDKNDWRNKLFCLSSYNHNSNAFSISAVDDSYYKSEELKRIEIEEERRKKEERERKRAIEEIKRQREISTKEEYQRVQKSNELFLARHHILTPTQKYIEKFCQPSSSVNIHDREIIKEALFPKDVEYEAVKKHNSMLYREYLKTPLWRIISNKVKYNAMNKCEQCGSSNKLEVHHISYEFKGVEFLKFEDLRCLCHQCHLQEHQKNEREIKE